MRVRFSAALLAFLLAPPGARGAGTRECERLLNSGDEEHAASCFLRAWRGGAPAAPIASRLTSLKASGRAGGWLLQPLAVLQAVAGDKEADATFSSAVDFFVRRGDRRGEAIARARKGIYYSRFRRFGESEAELRTADAAAAASGRPDAVARVRLAEAELCLRREDPLGGLGRLDAGEAVAQAAGDDDLLSDWHETRASLLWAAGRYAESLESYRRQIEALDRLGDRGRTATVLADMAIVAGGKERRVAFAREALARAEESGNLSAEVSARFTLAEVEGGPEALDQALAALAAARKLGADGTLRMALRVAGYRLVENGRREGLALLKEAVESAVRSGNPAEEARCRFVLSRALWEAGPREEAIRESLGSLDAAEATRRTASSATSRSVRFAQWSSLYYRAAGYLLSGALLPQGAEIPGDDVSLAFRIAERMKARNLLDVLDGGASVSDVSGTSSDFVSLEGLREALAPDEALLSFLINAEKSESGQAFDGGSWVLAVTRAGVRVFRLATHRSQLQDEERLFVGLIESRRGDEADGATALHTTLFAQALASLPPGIRRLLVVPDRALHGLPLGLLRPSPDAEPLIARYEIVSVPSATVWFRLRRLGTAAAAALSLADPSLPAAARSAGVSPAERSAGLGPLAFARREGRALVRRAGPGSRLLAGPEATEAALKRAPLSSYGLLHLGAHGVTDDENPQRTAVLLAPGDGEDGTLGIEEIRRLPLSGQLVAISACRSATGAYFAGDGYLGLTSAFLLAGSRAVLGTLWRVRDDEAEEFATAFYSELGRGRPAAAALAGAQRALRQRRRPPAAWAAFVLLGDGAVSPLAGTKPPGPVTGVVLGVTAVVLLVVLGALALRRRGARVRT